jgi:hypothetical protein
MCNVLSVTKFISKTGNTCIYAGLVCLTNHSWPRQRVEKNNRDVWHYESRPTQSLSTHLGCVLKAADHLIRFKGINLGLRQSSCLVFALYEVAATP